MSANSSVHEEVRRENEAAMLRRWRAVAQNKEQAMSRFGLTMEQADELANMTVEQVQAVSGMSYSIFRLNVPLQILKLSRFVSDPTELDQLCVMQHG